MYNSYTFASSTICNYLSDGKIYLYNEYRFISSYSTYPYFFFFFLPFIDLYAKCTWLATESKIYQNYRITPSCKYIQKLTIYASEKIVAEN